MLNVHRQQANKYFTPPSPYAQTFSNAIIRKAFAHDRQFFLPFKTEAIFFTQKYSEFSQLIMCDEL